MSITFTLHGTREDNTEEVVEDVHQFLCAVSTRTANWLIAAIALEEHGEGVFSFNTPRGNAAVIALSDRIKEAVFEVEDAFIDDEKNTKQT